jgi:cell division initiation protein
VALALSAWLFSQEYVPYALSVEGPSSAGVEVMLVLDAVSLPAIFIAAPFVLLLRDGAVRSSRRRYLTVLASFTGVLSLVLLALTPGPLKSYPSIGNPIGLEALLEYRTFGRWAWVAAAAGTVLLSLLSVRRLAGEQGEHGLHRHRVSLRGVRGRGYDRAEVDRLLDGVAESYEQACLERDTLRTRVEELERELGSLRESEDLVKETLLTAQRAAEGVRAQAQQEADRIVREGDEEGERLRERAKADLVRLQAEIERLKVVEQELRASLRAFLLAGYELIESGAAGPHDEREAAAPAQADARAEVS